AALAPSHCRIRIFRPLLACQPAILGTIRNKNLGDRGAREMLVSRLRTVLTLLVLSLVLYASVRAATMKVDGTLTGKPLGSSAEVLEDATGRLDFDAVRRSTDFRAAPALGTNFGFTHSTWWLRFTLANDGE